VEPDARSRASLASVGHERLLPARGRQHPPQGPVGEWVDKPNYFSVTVWGAQGDNCARYLSKGRPVAIDGRLEWREWEAKDGGKRESIEIVADSVQFLGGREDGGGNGNGFQQRSDVPVDTADFQPAAAPSSSSPSRQHRRRHPLLARAILAVP
jgi:single-strand DNA-binding protein